MIIQHTYDFCARKEIGRCCLIIFCSVLAVTGGKTTCSISYLEEDSKASLTCIFPVTANQTKRNFTVYRYSVHNVMQILLECHLKYNRFYCNKEDDVRYGINFTEGVTVDIPKNIMENSRLYWCTVADSEPHSTIPCVLPSVGTGPCTAALYTKTTILYGYCIFKDTLNVPPGNKCYWHLQKDNSTSVNAGISPFSNFPRECSISYPLPRNDSGVYRLVMTLEGNGQHFTNYILIERPDGLYTNCSRYIPEDTNASCQCGVQHPGIPPASASWDRYRPVSFLTAVSVRQENNSSVLGTCYLLWPGDGTDIIQEIPIHVAYGPYNESLFIEGPKTFVTNGSLWLTITCNASDVNPTPLITWEGVTCRNDNGANSQCTFMPPPDGSEEMIARCIAVNKYNHKQTAIKAILIDSTYFKNVEVEDLAERRLIIIVSIGSSLVVIIIAIVIVIIYLLFFKGHRISDQPEQCYGQNLGCYSNVLHMTSAVDKDKGAYEDVHLSFDSLKSSGLRSRVQRLLFGEIFVRDEKKNLTNEPPEVHFVLLESKHEGKTSD